MASLPPLAMRDAYGCVVYVPMHEAFQALIAAKVTIFGMDMETIMALRHVYLLRRGRLPMSKQSVEEAFGRQDIPYPLYFCEESDMAKNKPVSPKTTDYDLNTDYPNSGGPLSSSSLSTPAVGPDPAIRYPGNMKPNKSKGK